MSLAATALLLTTAPPLAAGSPARPVSSTTGVPTTKEIARALNAVKTDPNLAPERTMRVLRWADGSATRDRGSPSWIQWLAQLIAWIAQSARVLVWTAVVLLVALLGIYLLSLVRTRNRASRPNLTVAPTHVQDLDIRPESLPNDIGAAARALWDSGEHRAALSLLYRGLLSRLVHVHNVPIRDSSTEGDCLQLAATRLRDEKRGYVARLIQTWQHAVYGGQQPETGAIRALCDEFSPALDVA